MVALPGPIDITLSTSFLAKSLLVATGTGQLVLRSWLMATGNAAVPLRGWGLLRSQQRPPSSSILTTS